MIEQQGQVVARRGNRVEVRLGARSGCTACKAGRGCGAGVFGRLLKRRPVSLDFENRLDADPGQAVIVGIPESLFFSLVLRFYLLPLLTGLAGAAAGHYISGKLQTGPLGLDLATLAGALLGGAIAIRQVRKGPLSFSDSADVHLLRVAGRNLLQNRQEENL